MTNKEYRSSYYGAPLTDANTKLSRLQNGSWIYFDPNSLDWIDVDEVKSYVVVGYKVGIVKNNMASPSGFSVLLNVGDTLVRDRGYGVTYHKLPEGAKL